MPVPRAVFHEHTQHCSFPHKLLKYYLIQNKRMTTQRVHKQRTIITNFTNPGFIVNPYSTFSTQICGYPQGGSEMEPVRIHVSTRIIITLSLTWDTYRDSHTCPSVIGFQPVPFLFFRNSFFGA